MVFDFDGVIVDSEPVHWRAFREVLAPLGIPLSWEDYTDRYMGFDDRDAFREAFRSRGRELPADRLAELISAKSRAFHAILSEGIRPLPGAVPLVRSIRSRGIPLAVCSGALRTDIDPILASLRLSDCFDRIVSAEEVERSKPDPASYRLAWSALKERFPERITVPERSLAVEDTPAGIASAKGAGLSVLAVAGSHPREELEGADVVAGSLEEVSISPGRTPP
ncbi:MAG: HAD family phosphatase [Deltaproteobacteria bacterium]